MKLIEKVEEIGWVNLPTLGRIEVKEIYNSQPFSILDNPSKYKIEWLEAARDAATKKFQNEFEIHLDRNKDWQNRLDKGLPIFIDFVSSKYRFGHKAKFFTNDKALVFTDVIAPYESLSNSTIYTESSIGKTDLIMFVNI